VHDNRKATVDELATAVGFVREPNEAEPSELCCCCGCTACLRAAYCY
jgi:hypothetical protein